LRGDNMDPFGLAWQLELPYLGSPYAQAAFIILLSVLVAVVVVIILGRYLKRWAAKTKTKLDDLIIGLVRPTLVVLIILGGVVTALRLIPELDPLIPTMDRLYVVVLIAVAIWIMAKIFRAVLWHYGSELAKRTKTNLDDVLIPVFEKVGLFFIYFIGVMVLLSHVGIDILPLLTGMGILGLAVALAAADIIKNLLAGFYILVDQPLRVGDRVILPSGEVCDVVSIGARSTRLHNVRDNTFIVLPNSEVSSARIINVTLPDERMRTFVELGIAYTSDVDEAMKIMRQVLEDHERVLKDPGYEVLVDRVTDFLVMIKAKFWVESYEYKSRTEGEVMAEMLRRLKAKDIQVGRR